jgi:predicted Ser/Thr protein kinase
VKRLDDNEKRLDDEKKQLNERLNELIKQHGQASGMLLISYFVIVNVSRTRLSVDYYDCVTPPDVLFMELPSATVSWKLRPK